MQCPGCHQPTISAAARLRVALRAQVRCPVCGIQVQLTGLPRTAHTLTGDLSLLAGFGLAVHWMAVWPLALAIGWWTALGLLLPISPADHPEQ